MEPLYLIKEILVEFSLKVFQKGINQRLILCSIVAWIDSYHFKTLNNGLHFDTFTYIHIHY